MKRILLVLKQALRKSLLILGLMVFLSSLFSFVQLPSYAVQGINEMVEPEAKIRQKVYEEAKEANRSDQEAYEKAKKRPLDVEAEQVKKGVVEEGKVVFDLLTGKKPDGKSVLDSDKE